MSIIEAQAILSDSQSIFGVHEVAAKMIPMYLFKDGNILFYNVVIAK